MPVDWGAGVSGFTRGLASGFESGRRMKEEDERKKKRKEEERQKKEKEAADRAARLDAYVTMGKQAGMNDFRISSLKSILSKAPDDMWDNLYNSAVNRPAIKEAEEKEKTITQREIAQEAKRVGFAEEKREAISEPPATRELGSKFNIGMAQARERGITGPAASRFAWEFARGRALSGEEGGNIPGWPEKKKSEELRVGDRNLARNFIRDSYIRQAYPEDARQKRYADKYNQLHGLESPAANIPVTPLGVKPQYDLQTVVRNQKTMYDKSGNNPKYAQVYTPEQVTALVDAEIEAEADSALMQQYPQLFPTGLPETIQKLQGVQQQVQGEVDAAARQRIAEKNKIADDLEKTLQDLEERLNALYNNR